MRNPRPTRGSGIDFGAYGRAFVLLARNPTLMLAPLAASLALSVIFLVLGAPNGNDGLLANFTGGITLLIRQLLDAFGLGVALIGADLAWRRNRSRFDEAWEQARARAGDILLAALGLSFIIWAATLVGGLAGLLGSIALAAAAQFFFVYTIPAAAIGGVPGGAALQISLERARRTWPATLVVTVVYVLAYIVLPFAIPPFVSSLVLLYTPSLPLAPLVSVISALVKGLAGGYVALVLAKAYNDASYGRFR